MIELRDVAKTYAADHSVIVPAVRDANLVIEDGDFIVIIGRSGSGKTTLLNIMAGLTAPASGLVLYDGVEVWKFPDAQQSLYRYRHVGFVFQFPSLMPSLTVLANVLLPTTFYRPGNNSAEQARWATQLVKEVGLDASLRAFPAELSPGQQQRAVIARALVNKPEVLFADEPAAGLDQQSELDIMALFQRIHRRLGVTIVLVTESSALTCFGTRALHMAGGRLAELPTTGAPVAVVEAG
jgi:ABC-type lipoprotein export system ATPase subunit